MCVDVPVRSPGITRVPPHFSAHVVEPVQQQRKEVRGVCRDAAAQRLLNFTDARLAILGVALICTLFLASPAQDGLPLAQFRIVLHSTQCLASYVVRRLRKLVNHVSDPVRCVNFDRDQSVSFQGRICAAQHLDKGGKSP